MILHFENMLKREAARKFSTPKKKQAQVSSAVGFHLYPCDPDQLVDDGDEQSLTTTGSQSLTTEANGSERNVYQKELEELRDRLKTLEIEHKKEIKNLQDKIASQTAEIAHVSLGSHHNHSLF